jgi:hypothetical protein
MTNILIQEVTKPQCTNALLQLGDNKYSLTSTGVVDVSHLLNGFYLIELTTPSNYKLSKKINILHNN